MKTFTGGIELKYRGRSRGVKITQLTPPKTLKLKIKKPEVEAGESILVGSFLGSGVVSPVSGKIVSVNDGYVIIENDFKENYNYRLEPHLGDITETDKDELIDIIEDAGITYGKKSLADILVKYDGLIDTLIVNSVESDIYVSNKYHLVNEHGKAIVGGCKILQYILGLQNATILADDDLISVFNRLEKEIHGNTITLENVKRKYPQDNNRILVRALSGIPSSQEKNPLSLGILVLNCEIAAQVYYACVGGNYAISHLVTVDGDCVEPHCFSVLNGTTAKDIIDLCKIDMTECFAVYDGGVMRGKPVIDYDMPVSSSLIFLSEEAVRRDGEFDECIRCGKCADVCPVFLKPYKTVEWYNGQIKAEKVKIKNCIKCGCCDYVCPSKLPLRNYSALLKREQVINSVISQDEDE